MGKILDVKGDESKVKEILDGTEFDLPLDVRECLEWISGLKRKNVPTTDLQVERKSFKEFVRGVKESKSSSPSGRHYGHYKALLEDEELFEILYLLVETALEAGVILKRWETVHQIQLLKDSPRKKVHRFRNITLVEAD